ncbi:hypothetical protein PGTUg99_032615 [Puccinia graminis f. sp. tritici]|uniref:Uncharacterized protein n=1 Tax=Puccinia graminis f. sp. tritici TaxID=56615 RepID=A0A5B0SE65_PUCGR|nr:hypothetical protein PGTUg99_032615 [Puccinia graminis f. sp. tritici]
MNISITSLAILVLVFQVTMAYEQCDGSRPIFSCATSGPDTRIYAPRGSLCVSGAKWCCPHKAFLKHLRMVAGVKAISPLRSTCRQPRIF